MTTTMARLLASAAILAGGAAHAQESGDGPLVGEVAADGEGEAVAQEIVVTGSRIRSTNVTTAAPIIEVGQQAVEDRGYVSAAEALNDLPSAVPQLNQADGSGESSGSGQQFPNLFNLGPGRTLTLINGRRMVTSSSGIGAPGGVGDAQVDSNIIPLGLLRRVEVYQGGGAAVYGSDAIAGVVNYILRDDFTGVELDGQTGISDRGDYETYALRGTAGTDFADGRGNVAVDVGWSSSPILRFTDRPLSNLGRLTVNNPEDTGPDDGIPQVREIFNARFWPFNANGVVFTNPAPPPNFLTQLDGHPIQFAPDGSIVPYDTGTLAGIPFASGGDGFPYQQLAGLRTGVERLTGTMVGHYDLTDRIRVSTELLYAKTEGTEIPQGNSRTVLNAGSYAGPIAFTVDNPFLTDQARAALIEANPAFAGGRPLFLSKLFLDLVPDPSQRTKTETYRAVLGLDGTFDVGDREFYWDISGSYSRVDGQRRSWEVVNSRFDNAIDAVRSGGQIVCAINADADPSNDDPSCAPINPFGNGNVSAEAREYVSTIAGIDWTNEQVDVLATLGGTLFTLPGGDVQFSAAYEHRDESARFDPLEANREGSFGAGAQQVPQSGSYNTDELSGELLIPLVGEGFTLPLVHSLEAKGAFRYVDNSLAGKENVWDLGLRWQPVRDVTLRASRSRNFRAPTLTQLLVPTSEGLDAAGIDPCDADRIAGGPNPDIRRANCLALFEANPGYGVDADGAGAGLSADERLARFQSGSENFQRALITSRGNPDLRNEISDTFTYGIVIAPSFVPGLTITADRVEIDLEDGLSLFTTENFAATCFDDPTPDPAFCNAFTRLAAPDGVSPGGTIVTGTTTTVNAGEIRYRGEVYAIEYAFRPGEWFGGDDLGRVRLGINATHNTLLERSVTGSTFVREDDTSLAPEWVGRFNLVYDKGPLRLTYQADYRGETRAGPDATIENNPNPILEGNTVHNVSAQLDLGDFVLRGGIDNLTDKSPSYPQIAYGDILGRRFFVGVKIRLK
ncbi:TonB-dependent receptor domain-containing protein [Pelagerythrobacter rhizovicinus]|nr:TonB-dependent receptor [Pelagerythrobacter rhizovicinus]